MKTIVTTLCALSLAACAGPVNFVRADGKAINPAELAQAKAICNGAAATSIRPPPGEAMCRGSTLGEDRWTKLATILLRQELGAQPQWAAWHSLAISRLQGTNYRAALEKTRIDLEKGRPRREAKEGKEESEVRPCRRKPAWGE